MKTETYLKKLRIPVVKNMTSPSGRSMIPNQFIIKQSGYTAFQSYHVTIAIKTPNGIFLDKNYWDYSATTGKYRNQFLGEGIAETRKKIKEGVYELVNLNS